MTIPSNPANPPVLHPALQRVADAIRPFRETAKILLPGSAPDVTTGPDVDALAQVLRERIWAYGAVLNGTGYEPVGAQEYPRAGIDDARDVVLRDPNGVLWDVNIRVTIRRRPTGPCVCGPDATGEGPDGRPDCPHHGASAVAEYDGEAPY